jgi:BirA family transcriptional regulator, biotin operon repressor / biotin---[acetyl-CoA-carboxylase] ligase
MNVWRSGFQAVRDNWLARAIGIGETVTMIVGAQTHHGVFEDIDETGAIILRHANGVSNTFHAGDLVIPSLQDLRKETA